MSDVVDFMVVGDEAAEDEISAGRFGGNITKQDMINARFRNARAALDAAHAIPGDAHWKARKDKTPEQNRAARSKHDHAHRAVEHCSALLWHTILKGHLTPAEQEQAAALFAEAKRVRGY